MKVKTFLLFALACQFYTSSVCAESLVDRFYKLLQSSVDRDNNIKNSVFSAVATDSWKKDLFTFCRDCKEQIETNPDPQLIYSSIAVSHFDNLMELASKSQALSENILSTLSKAIKAKADFEDCNCPDFARGLTKVRLKRFEGSKIAEFAISLPADYESSQKWPMILYPIVKRFRAMNNYKESSSIILLWWHLPTPFGYEWKDYKFFLDIIVDKINVDKDKIYVNGECLDGISSVDLGLHYPDQWAECSASLGNASRQFAGNALNLPLIFVQGVHDKNHLVSYYDFAVECFKYYGCKTFTHSKSLNTDQARGSSIPTERRNLSPYRVFYTIESLSNPGSYWVKIDGRENENLIASLDAIVWGQSILVKTDNVDAYTLNLELAPLDCNRPVEIIEDSEHLDSVTGPVFVRKSPKYKNATYVKNKSLHGPVADIFTDQYAVIWKGDESTKRLAEQLAGTGPCYTDDNLPSDLIETHNLVFVGRDQEWSLFTEISEQLPIKIYKDTITAGNASYNGDLGIILVHPNPLNPTKYLAIYSGTSNNMIDNLWKVWNKMKDEGNYDVSIFKVSKDDQIQWLRLEKFNTVWNWQEGWDNVLTTSSQKQVKLRWQQWLANIIREELKADMAICESPFKDGRSQPSGPITYRDFFNCFKNEWYITVEIDAEVLQKLLAPPFTNEKITRTGEMVISDWSMLADKSGPSKSVLAAHYIKEDKLYTLALPARIANGDTRIDLTNYRIVGEAYLIPLLFNYIEENNGLDLDSTLSQLQLHIF